MTFPHDCDRRVARLFDHWNSLRPAPGTLPGRQHFDPAALLELLPHVWLCDVQRDPLRFRYRLVGTGITLAMEREVTGRWLDEVHPAFTGSSAFADFVATARTGAPRYYRGVPSFHLNKDYIVMERLLLPLAEDGVHPDMLFGITVYSGPLPPPDALPRANSKANRAACASVTRR